MFQKFRPLHNNVWVQILEEEKKTAGGLFIPDAAKTETQTGVVIAVGKGVYNPKGEFVPVQVVPGDKVFFAKYAGTKAGDSFLVLSEQDILGVVEL